MNCKNVYKGEWYLYARQILQRNKINIYIYTETARGLLVSDCKMFQNIMVVGPANWRKTFTFKSLQVIFHEFCKPGSAAMPRYSLPNKKDTTARFLRES